jgi:hypothetical protein
MMGLFFLIILVLASASCMLVAAYKLGHDRGETKAHDVRTQYCFDHHMAKHTCNVYPKGPESGWVIYGDPPQ